MTAAGPAGFRLLRLETAPPVAVAQLLVPAGSPIFAGHFPDRPLLPGIAHLALLRMVLRELAARGGLPIAQGTIAVELAADTAIAEVRKLRLRRPVSPGNRLELRLNAVTSPVGTTVDAADVIRFELRRQPGADQPSEVASEGTVRLGAGRPPAGALAPPQGLTGAAGFPPVAGLLPHAPPARLLAAVLAAGAGGIVCDGVIPAAHPLAEDGRAPGFLAIELAAQAAAALQALMRPPVGGPRIGYLVGVRGALLPAALPTGRTLRVIAVPAGGAAALATYDMELSAADGGERLAAGAISTFVPES
jgi:predicted hotdog family 3-hydroxylacyl-ACP dehydratase/3-hydroxymyristoyl/3-hydroxydecanoyl-(acyl carrier protein) dehydratase